MAREGLESDEENDEDGEFVEVSVWVSVVALQEV